jgi:hypothetical protein
MLVVYSLVVCCFRLKSVAPLNSIEQHVHSDLESSNPFGLAFAVANSDALIRDFHRLRYRPDPFPQVAVVAIQCLGCRVHSFDTLERDFAD